MYSYMLHIIYYYKNSSYKNDKIDILQIDLFSFHIRGFYENILNRTGAE